MPPAAGHFLAALQVAAAITWVGGLTGSLCALIIPHSWRTVAFAYGKASLRTNRAGCDNALPPSPVPAVPKSWFTGFYVIGLTTAIAALRLDDVGAFHSAEAVGDAAHPDHLKAKCSAAGSVFPITSGWAAVSTILLLYCCHLLRRLYECVAVHNFSPTARMPLHLWLAGMLHYLAVPFTLIPAALPSCIVGMQPAATAVPSMPQQLVWWPTVVGSAAARGVAQHRGSIAAAGLLLFVAGNVAQHVVHLQLAALRPRPGRRAVAADASVPPPASRTGTKTVASQRSRASRSPSPRRRQQPVDALRGHDEASSDGLRLRVHKSISAPESHPAAAARSPAAADLLSGEQQPAIPTPAMAPEVLQRRYPLPAGGLFDWCLCPHYTAEVAVYAGLLLMNTDALLGVLQVPAAAHAALTAARAQLSEAAGALTLHALLEIARLLMPALRLAAPALLVLWVAANLTATALSSKHWYAAAYGPEALRRRAAIWPGLL